MYLVRHDILSRYYTSYVFGDMIIFRTSIFYLFGPPIFIYSAVPFRPNEPTSVDLLPQKQIIFTLDISLL